MTHTPSLDLTQKLAPNMKQMQRLMMSPHMQQALHLLQLPLQELSTLVENELEQNPVIETTQNEEENEPEEYEEGSQAVEKDLKFDEKDFDVLRRLDDEFKDYVLDSGPPQRQRTAEDDKFRTYQESSIRSEESLFEHLMQQAKETFSDEKDLQIAESIIGSLDEKGYLKSTLAELEQLNGFKLKEIQRVLKEIQTFDPYGVGASSVQETLLIQLKLLNKQNSLAYKIIENHYQELLHNRIPLIQRALECTAEEINEAIQNTIAKLDLHPGMWFSREPVATILPDAVVKQEDEQLIVTVNDDVLPLFRLNRKYFNYLEDESLTPEAKEFIKEKIISAKWLLRNIHQRQETLFRIVTLLTEKQREYFINPSGKLIPLTMKQVSEELEVHESTVARAVSGKYIDTPRGLILLRSFFTSALGSDEGVEISSQTVRDLLEQIIKSENKQKPLSDDSIARLIQEKGIQCARRTVAKYRGELNLGNAHQRRKFK